jgi:dienelactone hydrolase
MASSWENINVDNSKMRVYLSQPENSRPAPAVVVVQGQTGVDDFVKFSDLVATHGIVAAAPDLYHRDPPDCKDDAPTRCMRLRDANGDLRHRCHGQIISNRTSLSIRARSVLSVFAWAAGSSI